MVEFKSYKICTYYTNHMQISKETVLRAIIEDYKDDLDFIEAINNLTYQRKVQLKTNLNQPKNVNKQKAPF